MLKDFVGKTSLHQRLMFLSSAFRRSADNKQVISGGRFLQESEIETFRANMCCYPHTVLARDLKWSFCCGFGRKMILHLNDSDTVHTVYYLGILTWLSAFTSAKSVEELLKIMALKKRNTAFFLNSKYLKTKLKRFLWHKCIWMAVA